VKRIQWDTAVDRARIMLGLPTTIEAVEGTMFFQVATLHMRCVYALSFIHNLNPKFFTSHEYTVFLAMLLQNHVCVILTKSCDFFLALRHNRLVYDHSHHHSPPSHRLPTRTLTTHIHTHNLTTITTHHPAIASLLAPSPLTSPLITLPQSPLTTQPSPPYSHPHHSHPHS
jgi:hypothetical protein